MRRPRPQPRAGSGRNLGCRNEPAFLRGGLKRPARPTLTLLGRRSGGSKRNAPALQFRQTDADCQSCSLRELLIGT
jgi:hypothetical protein